MSAMAVDIKTVLNQTGNRNVCHTIGDNDWALCGAYKSTSSSGSHTAAECAAKGHKHCVLCEELERQLGNGTRTEA